LLIDSASSVNDSASSVNDSASSVKRIISYFPIRYYATSLLFAIILVNSAHTIAEAEAYVIGKMLYLFQIPSFLSQKSFSLFIGDSDDEVTKLRLPLQLQILFLVFFPTIAATAKTSLMKRMRILSIGVLCFFSYIVLLFLLSLVFYGLDINDSGNSLLFTSVALTIICGGLSIHLALFSTITLPERTKIKPAIKRKYVREYLYLATVLTTTGAILFALQSFLQVDIDSPMSTYIHIYFWLNFSAIINVGYWVANLLHDFLPPWIRKRLNAVNSPPKQCDDYPSSRLSISFLIPAYNEERWVGRLVESIDRAAGKYGGKVEIILVNDGSTDNTEKIVADAMRNLKYSIGKLFTISNSGKGFALDYGLKKASGDIIFRTDADSMIDENALTPMMAHFNNPQVGSVCGWVYPFTDGKGLWQKTQRVICAHAMYIRRAQETFDSLLIQPGSSTAFRRDALSKTGGWVDNIFGEDGEIGNRVARYGYRCEFEPRSIVYSDFPETLMGLLQQRARWGVAFYQSRGRNWRLAREFRAPRSLFFLWDLISHGTRFARNFIWTFFGALLISYALGLVQPGILPFHSMSNIPWVVIAKIASIHILLATLQLVLFWYQMRKVKQGHIVKYYPFLRLISMIITIVVRPLVMNALLRWSLRWKQYDTESFRALRRVVKSVDPQYPSGD
jgi:cellulose synthase/poly-beta-1,6-N-acetylglucosamine synthase-like glycosyltransferase